MFVFSAHLSSKDQPIDCSRQSRWSMDQWDSQAFCRRFLIYLCVSRSRKDHEWHRIASSYFFFLLYRTIGSQYINQLYPSYLAQFDLILMRYLEEKYYLFLVIQPSVLSHTYYTLQVQWREGILKNTSLFLLPWNHCGFIVCWWTRFSW